MAADGLNAAASALAGPTAPRATPLTQRDEVAPKIAAALSSAEASTDAIYDRLTALLEAQVVNDEHTGVSGHEVHHDRPDVVDQAAGDDRGGFRRWANAEAAPLVAGHARSGLRRSLGAFIVGMIVPVAAGGVTVMLDRGTDEPPAVIADRASQAESSVMSTSGATNLRAEHPVQAREPVQAKTAQDATTGAEQERAIESGIGAGRFAFAHASEETLGSDALAQPVDRSKASQEEPVATEQELVNTSDPASGVERHWQAESPLEGRSSGEAASPVTAVPSAPTASEQASPPQGAPSLQSGSDEPQPTIDRAGEAVAPTRKVRVIKAVNLRAGPDNRKAVLTVIPDGSSVSVVGCRHWCEVIFAGQRGWIYKSFIGIRGSAAVSVR